MPFPLGFRVWLDDTHSVSFFELLNITRQEELTPREKLKNLKDLIAEQTGWNVEAYEPTLYIPDRRGKLQPPTFTLQILGSDAEYSLEIAEAGDSVWIRVKPLT